MDTDCTIDAEIHDYLSLVDLLLHHVDPVHYESHRTIQALEIDDSYKYDLMHDLTITGNPTPLGDTQSPRKNRLTAEKQ